MHGKWKNVQIGEQLQSLPYSPTGDDMTDSSDDNAVRYQNAVWLWGQVVVGDATTDGTSANRICTELSRVTECSALVVLRRGFSVDARKFNHSLNNAILVDYIPTCILLLTVWGSEG